MFWALYYAHRLELACKNALSSNVFHDMDDIPLRLYDCIILKRRSYQEEEHFGSPRKDYQKMASFRTGTCFRVHTRWRWLYVVYTFGHDSTSFIAWLQVVAIVCDNTINVLQHWRRCELWLYQGVKVWRVAVSGCEGVKSGCIRVWRVAISCLSYINSKWFWRFSAVLKRWNTRGAIVEAL